MECATWLADAQVPFSLVFTKTDKRKKGVPNPQQNIDAFQVNLEAYCPSLKSCPSSHNLQRGCQQLGKYVGTPKGDDARSRESTLLHGRPHCCKTLRACHRSSPRTA